MYIHVMNMCMYMSGMYATLSVHISCLPFLNSLLSSFVLHIIVVEHMKSVLFCRVPQLPFPRNWLSSMFSVQASILYIRVFTNSICVYLTGHWKTGCYLHK